MKHLRSSLVCSLLSLVNACSTNTSELMDVAPRDQSVEVVAADTTPIDVSLLDASTPDVAPTDTLRETSTDAVSPENCPVDAPEMMIAAGDITTDTTWNCTRSYRLTGLTFVRNATLTIRPGTQVRALGVGAALVITRGARIDAQGTRAQPIVFTSANPVGMRSSGDWAGLVLLGNATINRGSGTPLSNNIEGIETSDARGQYGGSDDRWNCGTVRYVRIEFAGQGISMGNELNGLTTGGCGRDTTIDYVQVHLAADDGMEFFGGTHDVRHVLITRADDDGLDWDFGWRGRAQFVAIQGPTTSNEQDPRAIEADNEPMNNDALPRSAPTLSNLTIVGASGAEPYTQPAIVLRRGTAGRIYNSIIMDYKQGAIDVINPSTVLQTTTDAITVARSLFFRNGADQTTHFTDLSAGQDNDFDENLFFRAPARMNRFDLDPQLRAPYELATPNFQPAANSPAAQGAEDLSSDTFFENVPYLGAIAPGEATDWTQGWTAYPLN